MPARSAAFGTLTIVSCCLLQPFVHPARATPGPAPSPNHQEPAKPAAPTVELPAFQAGLWLYRRTVVKDDSPSPRISMLRKCADPSTEIRTKMAQLESRSCQFTPFARQQNRYTASWTCPTPHGPMSFRAVLIVKGATGYTDLSEIRSTQHVARQRIEAIRIGACPENGPSTPRTPNFKPRPRAELRG